MYFETFADVEEAPQNSVNINVAYQQGMAAGAELGDISKQCKTNSVSVQENKIRNSVMKISSVMETGADGKAKLKLLTENDDVFKEVISILAAINGVLEDKQFMDCMSKAIVKKDEQSCLRLGKMLEEDNREIVQGIIDRFSFVVPTILLFSLKMMKAVHSACPGIDQNKVNSLYDQTLNSIEKIGSFMDLNELDKQLKIVDQETGKLVKKEGFRNRRMRCGCSRTNMIYVVVFLVVVLLAFLVFMRSMQDE